MTHRPTGPADLAQLQASWPEKTLTKSTTGSHGAPTAAAGNAPGGRHMMITSTQCPIERVRPAGQRVQGDRARRPTAGRTGAAGPPVPFITPRSGEELVPTSSFTLRSGGTGVGYRQERREDRDGFGVLWWRATPPDARARPQFRDVDGFRQRDVMFGLLCQVCGGPPSRTSRGVLFFHRQPPESASRWWPNSDRTFHPPVCLPCARAAIEYCPYVGTATAVRVKKPHLWGILGTAFVADSLGGVLPVSHGVECRYDNLKQRRWIVAQQAILELDRATVVDLREELAAAGLKLPGPRTS